MTIIEQIKAEIERRVDILATVSVKQAKDGDSEMSTYYHGKAVSLEELIHFLSTLESEKPIIPNDLEEAAKKYAKTAFKKQYSNNPDEEVTIVEPDKYVGFIAGAKYEDEQLPKKIAAAYQLGLADKEKQMMSKAVEGTVYGNGGYTWVAGDIPSQFKYGDKVRVIVLPKEN